MECKKLAALPAAPSDRANLLYAEHQQRIYRHNDRIFAGLMLFQWTAGIAAAFWLSPRTWAGTSSHIHIHVIAAVFLGGLITLYPVFLAAARPGTVLTRHSIAVGQLLMSGLLIHLTGGRIETHFHVFGSLAFLAFYRDWRVILTATLVTAADHCLRGFFWPQSIYGVLTVEPWRWLEHAGWVIFEDVFLILSCIVSSRELHGICDRDAKLEQSNSELEEQVEMRTASLRATHSALENAVEGISEIDAEGRYRTVNAAYARMVGYSSDEMIGMEWQQIVFGPDRTRLEQAFKEAYIRGKYEVEVQGIRKDGSLFHKEVVIIPNYGADGAFTGHFCFMKDVSERKKLEAKIEHQAFHDALSGLPNRILFNDRVEHALIRARRQEAAIAVMFIDLDNFKFINDSLGHEQGDRLLVEVAHRLEECVRQSDTVARMGGDEFTILMEGIETENEAIQVAERVVERLRTSIRLATRDVFISSSIGIAISSQDNDQADTLLRNADAAMYQAKLNGKAGYVVFDPSMNDRIVERLEIEIGLRRALEQGEFHVFYQPIIDLETGRTHGAEALVRWEHPKLGMVSPAKFVPIAEETGLIVPLGAWVLKQACLQAKMWQTEYDDPDFVISVNLSGRQLQEPGLSETVAAVLKETGIRPSTLKLEITESVMADDIELVIARLNELKALGVLLAVDDFGTGYSSLSYLQRLPIDTVKIDQSFVNMMGSDSQPAAIIHAIITLCRVMKLNVTGEGIENADQLLQLQSLGCDHGQGYLFAKPVAGEDFEALLKLQRILPTEHEASSVRLSLDAAPRAA